MFRAISTQMLSLTFDLYIGNEMFATMTDGEIPHKYTIVY